jgi:N-acetylmuramoyl-L-alanine amidase
MRHIDTLILHCSATQPDVDVGVAEMDVWHKARGWKRIGYHFVIRRNGTVEHGRPIEDIGAHAVGFNQTSLGICLVGGVRRVRTRLVADDNFTEAQWATLRALVIDLLARFPHAKVIGHRDVQRHKDCPSFDVQAWLIRERIAVADPSS